MPPFHVRPLRDSNPPQSVVQADAGGRRHTSTQRDAILPAPTKRKSGKSLLARRSKAAARGQRSRGKSAKPALRTKPALRGKRALRYVARCERRSWFSLAVSGLGAVVLSYLRIVRKRIQLVTSKAPHATSLSPEKTAHH